MFLTYVDERERAIDLLEQAVDDRTFDSTMQIKANCLFDPLRDEPRFQSLLRRSGLG